MTRRTVAEVHVPSHDLPYVAGLAGAGFLLISTGLAWLRSRRGLRRRVSALALRLADDPRSVGSRLESLLTHVEKGVDRTVERAHESEAAVARLAGALDAVPWAVVVCDDEGQVAYRNRAAEALMSGGPADALVRRAVAEQLSPTAEPVRVLELLGPPARTVALRSAPIDDGRRAVGTLVVAEDVTEARRADRAEEDFVANAGLQLRAPIGAVVTLAEMVAEEGSKEVVRKLAARLVREAGRADRLIDDLVVLARVDRHTASTRWEAVPVGGLVARAVDRVRPLAAERGVSLEVIGDENDSVVRGESGELGAAVFNLVENAVKYSPPGATVRVETREDGQDVEVVVRDEGVGIPADDVERVFERFYRVDRGADDEGGSGLGLPIARQVARDHAGSVSVESREGHGSTFVLTLPRSDVRESECRTASKV